MTVINPLPRESAGSRRLALPDSHRSPALARAWVRQLLDEELVAEASCDLVDTVEMLTSELVTNAVLHGRSTLVVQLTMVADTVQIVVEDNSPVPPQSRDPEDFAEGGRGLLLVDWLASSWGWEVTPTGKYVWFRVDLPG